MKTPILVVVAVTLLSNAAALAASDSLQVAQDSQNTQAAPQRPLFIAPDQIQPTLQSLPKSITENEGKRTEDQKRFDKQLQICRGC